MPRTTAAISAAILVMVVLLTSATARFRVPTGTLEHDNAKRVASLYVSSVRLQPTATITVTPSSELADLIAKSRATVTPTPMLAAGEPIEDGLLWIYVRAPADKMWEMDDNGCNVRDDELDQSVWENDPYVIADEAGTILQQGSFAGTTRIRSEQAPWEQGTSDEGWTAEDDTRWCRLQGGVGSLSYSPTYQVVFGEKARGPYVVSWDSVVRNEKRMMLAVDLSAPTDAVVARTPVAVFSGSLSAEPVTTTTDPIPLTRPLTMVSADSILALGPFTVVAVTDDGRRFTLFDEGSEFAGFVNLPDLEGAKTVSFEVTASGLWVLAAW